MGDDFAEENDDNDSLFDLLMDGDATNEVEEDEDTLGLSKSHVNVRDSMGSLLAGDSVLDVETTNLGDEYEKNKASASMELYDDLAGESFVPDDSDGCNEIENRN